MKLYDYQKKAISEMHNGCILCGGVGSGKSRTSLAYYHTVCKGEIEPFSLMKEPMDLYIITTAKKRDSLEWEDELIPFMMTTKAKGVYSHKIVIDSWNNIGKYKEVTDAFFIFDEQRVVGKGAWVKSFLRIARFNKWILLSATPGDSWQDYVPVFLANGFFKTRTEFEHKHCILSPYTPFKKIEDYRNTGYLNGLRRKLLVNMDFKRETVQHHENIYCEWDIDLYKTTMRNRQDPFKDYEPFQNASGLCQCLRKIVNSHDSRVEYVTEIVHKAQKAIIFYNYDYELDILRNAFPGVTVAEWNGHKHEPVPDGDSWVYLVQYSAGNEGWNCITTDTIIFYSQNYSYKVMTQAAGRIDRLNTPYKDLWYYHLKSRSGIDLAIDKALHQKKKFNENSYIKW